MTAIKPIHPGEHLAEILADLGITQYRLAKTIGVPQIRINDIAHCRRSITADTALRIGRALGMTPEFWLNPPADVRSGRGTDHNRRRRYQMSDRISPTQDVHLLPSRRPVGLFK